MVIHTPAVLAHTPPNPKLYNTYPPSSSTASQPPTYRLPKFNLAILSRISPHTHSILSVSLRLPILQHHGRRPSLLPPFLNLYTFPTSSQRNPVSAGFRNCTQVFRGSESSEPFWGCEAVHNHHGQSDSRAGKPDNYMGTKNGVRYGTSCHQLVPRADSRRFTCSSCLFL